MKQFLLFATCLFAFNAQAQSYKETFDANTLEWTECASKNESGTAIIDKGFMTIESNGVNKFMSLMAGTQVGENTAFETHCYAPIDVMKSFKIRAHVIVEKLAYDKKVGLVFNYRDYGNYYAFAFNEESISFIRLVDNKLVGGITQGVKWKKKKDLNQEWELVSEGQELKFYVNGEMILKVRYMPLEYTGVGFYTFGKQTLKVDDIEFIQ